MSKSNIISGVEFLRQTLAGIPLTTDVATLSKIDDLTCTAANRIRELEVLKDRIIDQTTADICDLQLKLKAAETEVARLREVIWRNADPFDASDEDAAIIEEISRGITP
jgi:hypothetical protein